MRAVRVQSLTGPKAARVDEVADPKPDAGEVVVDVRAAGVNFPDVLLSYGKYQLKFEPPFTPGVECAGVVSAVGEGVTAFKPGDRVACTSVGGAFAEKLAVPVDTTVKLPDAVSFEVGAATLLTYGTSAHALDDRAQLAAGETLLVLGAAGGVGLAAVQLGKLAGARVIAAASTPQKVAFCREQGADEGICYGNEDLKERVKALTKGDGANVVYDPVGGAYSEPALRSIAWNGRFLVVGFAAGDIPKLPLNLVLLKACNVMGVLWGAWAMREPLKNRAMLERVLGHVAAGKLMPQIDLTLPFAKATEALERIERREVRGKIVLVP
jgi:NADPH2:quinone reductase